MNNDEALNVLDCEPTASFEDVRRNFKWLCWFYHPDNVASGSNTEFRVVQVAWKAYLDQLNEQL